MKPKTLVLMGVAIACGLGASYMTSRLLAERSSDDEPRITVLVARKNLNMGDTLRAPEELFQEKKVTRGDELPGAICTADELKNRILKRPLRTGDQVTAEDLMGDKDNAGMAVVLPQGYRAVGVKVNVESAAYGFATLPLSRVDIISTVRRADDKATYSQVLLENILVLAADDKMQRDESGKPMPSQVVTLALRPEDALKVALAGELGSLRLLLRKMNDTHKAESPKLTYEQLKTGEGNKGDDIPVETVQSSPSSPPTQVASNTKPPEAPKIEPVPVVEPKPSVPEVTPVTPVTPVPSVAPVTPVTPVAPPVAEVKEPVGKKHVLAITEGGRTRYVEFILNENNEVIGGDGVVGEPHPPRPQEAAPPKQEASPSKEGNM
jgi:pilus assembly protein CpaB